MADVPTCTQADNYSPRKIHITGRKFSPYDVTKNGVTYVDGSTYVGNETAEQPAQLTAPATATPNCGSCG